MQLQQMEITSSCRHCPDDGMLSKFCNVFLIISRTVFSFPYSTVSVLYEISKINQLQKISWQENEDVHQNLDRTVFTGSNFVASRNWIDILKNCRPSGRFESVALNFWQHRSNQLDFRRPFSKVLRWNTIYH